MGYTTDFEGEIDITPQLPSDYVAKINEMASQRNNTYGDGDEGSFDHVLHGKRGKTPPTEGLRNSAWTAVPGCWCQWVLRQDIGRTIIEWDGGEKFYDYTPWLAYLVSLIKRDNPGSKFSGTINWAGEDKNDLGQLRVSADGTVSSHVGTITYG